MKVQFVKKYEDNSDEYIPDIKSVRNLTEFDLKIAKDFVNGTPMEISGGGFALIRQKFPDNIKVLYTEELNPHRHFYLYAKRWYRQTNLIADLKKIQSEYCGLAIEHVRVVDILTVLSPVIYKHLNEHGFTKLIEGIVFPWSTPTPLNSIDEIVLAEYLAVLATIKKDEIKGGLGEADPNVLPLKD